MSITPLPTEVPTRDDPEGFDDRADAFLAALPKFAQETNAVQVDINNKQAVAAQSATSAISSAGTAIAAAEAAEESRSAAARDSEAAGNSASVATSKAEVTIEATAVAVASRDEAQLAAELSVNAAGRVPHRTLQQANDDIANRGKLSWVFGETEASQLNGWYEPWVVGGRVKSKSQPATRNDVDALGTRVDTTVGSTNARVASVSQVAESAVQGINDYALALRVKGAGLVSGQSLGDIESIASYMPDANGQAPIAVGINRKTGELFALFPVADPRLMANVDARLRKQMGALHTVESVPEKVLVLQHDVVGRPTFWADYREGSRGVYFLGQKVGAERSGGGTVRIIGGDGQSNRVGQSGAQRSLVYGEYYPHPDKVVMPLTAENNIWLGAPGAGPTPRQILPSEITGLTRLRSTIASTNAHGTTSSEGYAYAQMAKPNPFANFDGFCFFNAAEGNQNIANMLEGVAGQFYFQNQITCVSRINQLYNSMGLRVSYDFTEMCQGESGRSDATTGEKHELYRSQLEKRVRAITGQPGPLRMFSFQMSNFYDVENSANANLSILQQALSVRRQYALFMCPGPTFIYPWSSDFLHFTSVGHAMRGEYLSAVVSLFDLTGFYDPLYAVLARVTGPNQITVTMSEACVIDNAWLVAAVANAGVRAVGGIVSNVAAAASSVVITTEGPASAVTAIEFALGGHPEGGRTLQGVPRSTIRSAAAIGQWSAAVGGATMYKPACHQRINITA